MYHVLNLNESGPGSLRAGMDQGHRQIVFDLPVKAPSHRERYFTGYIDPILRRIDAALEHGQESDAEQFLQLLSDVSQGYADTLVNRS